MSDVIKKFLKLEAASGIILIMAAMLAMILANTALAGGYQAFLDTPVQVRIAALDINKPLLLWINDGFMAIFFLLVGLEVKREMLEGALSTRVQATFPAIAAVGGMLAPALIYAFFNYSDEVARAVDSQQQVGAHAARVGVTVGLEALNRFECYLLNTMADLAGFVRRVDHPNIRAMYDTFHSNIEEADPIAALTRHKAEVVHIHISENDRGVPGRGNIPWDQTFAAIRDIGYDGWLTIEAFGRGLPDLAAATKVWRDFAESPEAVYRDGFAHIVSHLQKAGLR